MVTNWQFVIQSALGCGNDEVARVAFESLANELPTTLTSSPATKSDVPTLSGKPKPTTLCAATNSHPLANPVLQSQLLTHALLTNTQLLLPAIRHIPATSQAWITHAPILISSPQNSLIQILECNPAINLRLIMAGCAPALFDQPKEKNVNLARKGVEALIATGHLNASNDVGLGFLLKKAALEGRTGVVGWLVGLGVAVDKMILEYAKDGGSSGCVKIVKKALKA